MKTSARALIQIVSIFLGMLFGPSDLVLGSSSLKIADPPGMIVEHTQNLKTLTMSFIDLNEPMLSIRHRILSEFLKAYPDPKLILIVFDQKHRKEMNELILKMRPDMDLKRVQYIDTATYGSSPWVRDYSPILYRDKDKNLKSVSFAYENDVPYGADQILLAGALKVPNKISTLKIEGGNLLTDENGKIFISEAAVENNLPDLPSPEDFRKQKIRIEKELKELMFASAVIWVPRLNKDLEGTGHVDMYIRFLPHQRAVVASSTNIQIKSTLDQIAKIVEAQGYKVIRIKANATMSNHYRQISIFPSYTNAILVGESIFIPKYGVPEDKDAVKAYQSLGLQVIQISGDSIGFGGSIHCLTYLYP